MRVRVRHPRSVGLLLAAAALAATACEAADPNVHPHLEVIAGSSRVRAKAAAPPHDGPLVAFRRDLEGISLVATVGSLQDPTTAFGSITDLAVDSAGHVYVLDRQNHEVREFAPDGTFRRRFGRRGDGPMEFRYPVALAFTPSGALVLATRVNVKFFDVADSAVTPTGTWPLVEIGRARDMCVLGHDLVIRTHYPDTAHHIVHLMGQDGVRRRSFARGYEHGNFIVRGQMSAGPIACTDEPARIIVGYDNLPIVEAFDTAGNLRWRAYIPDFTPQRLIESATDDGKPVATWDGSRPYNLLSSLESAPGGIVVAQVLYATPAEPGTSVVQRARTFAFSAEDGSILQLPDLPARVRAVTSTHLYAADSHPAELYPRLLIFRRPAAN